MSLRVVDAVTCSHLDRRLRHLAHMLAFHAGREDGSEIYPGVELLQKETGLKERAVREQLRELLAIGVIERDGYHGHTRKFRFNLEKLSRYRPKDVLTKPCTAMQGSKASKPRRNPARPRREPCISVPQTLHGDAAQPCTTMPHKEIERLNHKEQTAAGAAASSQPAPFRVYAAIATEALNRSLREDRTDNEGHVTELFKIGCAQHRPPLRYDSDIARKAVQAAMAARDRAKAEFTEKYQGVVRGVRTA